MNHINTPAAKITHLFHSGSAVETADHFLIFDYYQPFSGNNHTIHEGIITSDYLETKKNVFVFVSHNHADHFDPVILDWSKNNPGITYIISSDVQTNISKLNCHTFSAYQEQKIDQVLITSFGSTDQGVSFLVQVDGLSIFHAGDLNWWHWKGESLEERTFAESIFKAEIGKICNPFSNIDIAFFPIDRRLEEFYSMGAEYFASKLRPKLLVPMHFGNDFPATKAFAEKANHLGINTIQINCKGQENFFKK